MNTKPQIPLLLLAGTAVALLWGWHTVRMARAGGMMHYRPNPLAMAGSPYGRTLALVVQGPVDAYWHGGAESGHVHGPDCNHGHHDEEVDQMPLEAGGAGHGVLARAKQAVESLGNAVRSPNTKVGQTQAHVRYLRRQIEKKLETAYRLDPGNYANFNALVLFLTESALATRSFDMSRMRSLADGTIAHVEARENVNPEPWLTAASAAYVKVELQQQVKAGADSAALRETLAQMERCLARYRFLRDIKQASGQWEKISRVRRTALEERAHVLDKLLEAQYQIVEKQAKKPDTH